MNETPSPFEQELSSLKLRRAPQTDGTELFYRCGYEAALAAHTAHRPPRSGRTFVGGALTGIAASLLGLLGWTSLLDESPGETTRVIVESVAPNAPAGSDVPADPTRTAVARDADTESPAEQANAVAEFLVALRKPWNWSASEKSTHASHRPLSPAANQQWLSLIDDQASTSQAAVTQRMKTVEKLTTPGQTIRAGPLREDAFPDFF